MPAVASRRRTATAPKPIRFECPRAFAPLLAKKNRYRYYVFYGGRGAAKSHQVAIALLIKGHERRRRILCTREIQKSLKESVLQLLEHYIGVLGLGEVYTVTRTGIVHQNGTEFLFAGLRHNVVEIKSTEGIDICWVEEAQGVSEASWKVLTPTIRQPGSEIWITFNPNLADDPTYKRFVVNPPPNAYVAKVTYAANPWFPDVLLEEMLALRETDPEGYEHVWEGELWKRSALQILSNTRLESFEPEAAWHGPYYGLDFGFSTTPLALVRCYVFDNVLYVDHSAGGLRIMNDDLGRIVDEVPGAALHTIRADSSRPETIAHMIGLPRSPRLRVVGADKWAGSVEDGIVHLQSYKAIVIHTRAALAREQAKLWRFKADKLTGEPLRQPQDGNDDAWDAVRYALEPIIRQSVARFRPAILSGGSTASGTAPAKTTGRKVVGRGRL